MNQKSVAYLVKFLAFLPLLLLAGGVWYYLNSGRQKALPAGDSGPAATVTLPPSGTGRTAPPGQPPPAMALDIQGSTEFKAQVTAALKLIWEADRDTFIYIRDSFAAIRNENRTGFFMDEGRPAASISKEHAFRSVTWCAGILAHQAWHARYFSQNRKKVRLPPPQPGESQDRKYDANPLLLNYKGLGVILEMENSAAQYQLNVLKMIRAPRAETDMLLRREPRDFSHSHDGSYSLRP